MKLKNKVGIITGATSGMGKGIAQAFVKEGANLVLSGRNLDRGKELEKNLKGSIFIAGDISKPETNEQLVKETIKKYGKLDFISLNAGTLGMGNVVDLPISEWNLTLETNLSSIFYMAKYALPYLLKNDNGSILINASIAAFKSFPNHPAYCASKAASIALMKQMAVEYAPKIRINAMCPGPVDTPLLWDSAKAFTNPGKAIEDAKNATLLQRLGSPNDIAKLALFLISEDSSWITGSAFTIDGGIMNA
ncbi:SDR family oxidoreductase [Maribacter sp.]|uniref:SDR family NAD(P)-dependent oxidoreductase n=1 Tax=Maribacter sp. TaxID=1897614 RepID=UPI0025BBB24B|nr:SDR family oxidoreductase [Maribacter sp.]